MDSKKLLNFGSLNIDKVYKVPHFVQPGETLSSDSFTQNAGGKGLNQSIALARAGIKVFHAGKIGHDGDFLRQILVDNGVDTQFLITSDVPSGHAIIQINQEGQNCIILFPGANCAISREEICKTLSAMEKGDYLLLQNEINDIPFIMEEAKKRGMKIAINPAPCSEEVLTYPLHLADIIFVNEVEAATLAGINAEPEVMLAKIVEKFPEAEIIMTFGAKGAYYRNKDKFFHTPCYEAKVVDTTSAGDTFGGYYMSAVLQGFDVEKAMKIASYASSITVSRSGAAISIPAAAEVFGKIEL